jgi:hypothetical protein
MSGKSVGGLAAGSRLMRPLARTSVGSGGAASVPSRVSGGLPNRIAAAYGYGSVPGGRAGVRPKTGASIKAGREVPGLDEARKLLQQIAPVSTASRIHRLSTLVSSLAFLSSSFKTLTRDPPERGFKTLTRISLASRPGRPQP